MFLKWEAWWKSGSQEHVRGSLSEPCKYARACALPSGPRQRLRMCFATQVLAVCTLKWNKNVKLLFFFFPLWAMNASALESHHLSCDFFFPFFFFNQVCSIGSTDTSLLFAGCFLPLLLCLESASAPLSLKAQGHHWHWFADGKFHFYGRH